MINTAKYAWSFSRNSSFLRGLFYYAAPCRCWCGCTECGLYTGRLVSQMWHYATATLITTSTHYALDSLKNNKGVQFFSLSNFSFVLTSSYSGQRIRCSWLLFSSRNTLSTAMWMENRTTNTDSVLVECRPPSRPIMHSNVNRHHILTLSAVDFPIAIHILRNGGLLISSETKFLDRNAW